MGKRGASIKAELHRLQGGRCCYCDRPVELAPEPWPIGSPAPDHFATLEHLRRKVDGGTSHRDNLAVACHRCNSMRGKRSWVEFKTIMETATYG